MPKRTPTLSESTEEEFPALNGGKIKIRKARNGIVQFSTFLTEITDVEKKRVTFKDRIGLQWEGFSELMEDHGQATICGVLHPLGLYILSDAKKAQLLSDIKAKVPSFAYEKLEKYIASQEERLDESAIDSFIVAGWAELFAEPLQPVWLAAMAHHAFYFKKDDYAFGYLIAMLDQKEISEQDYLRGWGTLQNARQGGLARSMATAEKTKSTLAEIGRLVEAGHSIVRSSQLAFKKGFGTSVTANQKLWSRSRKK